MFPRSCAARPCRAQVPPPPADKPVSPRPRRPNPQPFPPESAMEMIQEGAHIARHETARATPLPAAGEYLTYHVGAEEYGVDIQTVQEIRSYEAPTRIPGAPRFVKGVVNLR